MLKERPARYILTRIGGSILLALAPSLLLSGLSIHADHTAREAQTPIFADARHAGEANHWEAAHSVRVQVCPVCLASAQPEELAPTGAAGQVLTAAGLVPSSNLDAPLELGAGRSQRSRAPPSA